MVSALALDAGISYDYHSEIGGLSRAKAEGWLGAIPALAEKARAALVPVEPQALIDRLTMLGMSMANGKDAEQVKAWLHETARLLADLPQFVLFDAIDDLVKEPGRVFLPSVGEIREKAAARLQKEERRAARLARHAKLIAEGVTIPDYQPPRPTWSDEPEKRDEPNCTPEQAAAILKEFGLPSTFSAAAYLKPEPPKSRADLIAEGITPPPIRADKPDPYAMMP